MPSDSFLHERNDFKARVETVADSEKINSLTGGAAQEIAVAGWPAFQSIEWAADGQGWYAASRSAAANTLLLWIRRGMHSRCVTPRAATTPTPSRLLPSPSGIPRIHHRKQRLDD